MCESSTLKGSVFEFGLSLFCFFGWVPTSSFLQLSDIQVGCLRGKHDSLPTQSDLETLIDFTKPQSLACVF